MGVVAHKAKAIPQVRPYASRGVFGPVRYGSGGADVVLHPGGLATGICCLDSRGLELLRLVAVLCLITIFVVAFGCGRDGRSVLVLPVDVKHETREFSTPVDEGGEGDTIAKDGFFIIEGTMGFLFFLEYTPERNEFLGFVGGYYTRAENFTIEVWLSNGIKLEPKPMKKPGEGVHSVVPIAFKVPDVPFVSWQARATYTPGSDW